MINRRFNQVAAAAFALAASPALGDTTQGARFGAGNTYNVYTYVTTPATWDQARVNAKNSTFSFNNVNYPGHLVAITSEAENTYILRAATGDAWIGLSDSDQTSTLDNVNIGGTEAGTNPNGGWKWVSGEPFVYQKFGTNEPNDSGGEDATQRRADGFWNDHQAGPSLGQGGQTFRYVIEYETQAAVNPAGVGLPRLNIGPSGGNGFVGIREVKTPASTPEIGSAQAAVDALQANQANPATYSRFEGTGTTINHRDPDAAGGAGQFGSAGRATFLNNVAGTDDNDFALIANGTIRVPTTGTYTFQVRGDDGFRLAIDGAEWVKNASSGDGGGVETYGDTAIFNAPTGDSNTFIKTVLTAGDHNLEFVFFERAGGAYTELSAAFGDFSAADAVANTNFHLLGDTANGGLAFVAIPEPGSLGVAGLAGLVLLARRRRRNA